MSIEGKRSVSWLQAWGAGALLCMVPWQSLWAGPDIQAWQTTNGARVLFVPAPELPILDVRVVFDAGSARDADHPGLAVLTNSLLPEGAGAWNADQVAERLEDVGAELSVDALRDMATVSLRSLTEPQALQIGLQTLAAVMAEPRFAPDDLERQRQAMQVSLRKSEQSPGSVAQKAFYRNVFGDHPYASDSGGTEESLRAIAREDVVAFHDRYYVARNAVIAMVGALSREEAEQIAERLMQGLPPGAPAAVLPDVPPLPESREERRSFPSTQSHIYVGQPGMRRQDPDYFPLYVGNHILGGSGLVSLLMGEVREKRGLSYSVYSYFLPMHQQGPFLMGAQTKNASSEQALQVMRDTLEEFIEQGPSAEGLVAAKRNITGGFPLRISSNQKILDYIAMIGFYGLPLDYLDTFNEKVNAVTAEQIRTAFQRRVDAERLVTVVVGGRPQVAAQDTRD